ncbi:MAG: zinc ribbon domain-containing protein [candidate division Zixibacteria bacterium]
MPIFEYQCNKCEHEFEELISGVNAAILCPNCKSTEVRKLLSTFAPTVALGKSNLPSCAKPGCPASSGYG